MIKIFKLKFILLAFLVLIPMLAGAVTQKEMEQARTIATKAYLRYANDGSGYLDDINPTTMEELEVQLKAKEKENIKAFKAIPVPSDYSGWDKEKLVEYWAGTAFQNVNLLEKGKGGRIRARSQINKMNIGVPAPQPEAPVATTANTPVAPAPETPAAATVNETETSAAGSQPDQVIADIQAQEDDILAQEEELEEEIPSAEKTSSGTWVYIMVLALLVGVVIALVVYAANVMKKNNGNPNGNGPFVQDPKISEKLEYMESAVADKSAEILMLNKRLESANRQNADLKAQVESLTAQLAAMKREESNPEKVKTEQPQPVGQPSVKVRSIYLGRANANGIFVRADRTLNVGNSVYVLETSDGFSGTFKVADSPAAWSLALSNPKQYLETACTGHNLEDTANASQIVTENPGTAVFEGGCWRMIRKARIRYE